MGGRRMASSSKDQRKNTAESNSHNMAVAADTEDQNGRRTAAAMEALELKEGTDEDRSSGKAVDMAKPMARNVADEAHTD
jgi:hypothetical protein